jgi:hypothetical protein
MDQKIKDFPKQVMVQFEISKLSHFYPQPRHNPVDPLLTFLHFSKHGRKMTTWGADFSFETVGYDLRSKFANTNLA